MIKAIIFDLGNVLIDFDHRIAARRIAEYSDKTGEEIFNLFFDSRLTSDFECGKIRPEEFFVKVKEMLALRIGYETFLPIWNEIFFLTEKNRKVQKLAVLLSRSYKLGILSNINILHMEYLQKNFPVFGAFHKVMTSCAFGVQKPDPRIYELAARQLETGFDEIFYTDDREELIRGANALGMHGFIFRSAEQLEIDLKNQGVIFNLKKHEEG